MLKLSTVSSFNHCFNSVSASRKDVAKNCICHCATLSERNPLDCVQRLKLDRRKKIHAKPLNPFDCHYELFHVFYLIASGKKAAIITIFRCDAETKCESGKNGNVIFPSVRLALLCATMCIFH